MNYENKVVELNANIHMMWKLQCRNLYTSTNLGALAVRECLQNSIDTVRDALNQRQIKNGRIDIDIDGANMSISDNGMGMDIETIHTKFLTLGETTKDNEDNTGGFGLAKSVILGCGSGFKVETQDNVFSSDDLGKSPIRKQEYRQGTKITLYNVQSDKDELISVNPNRFIWAIEDYVATSVLPKGIVVYLNGQQIKRRYRYTASNTKFAGQFGISSDMIPQHTELKINVCKTPYSLHYIYIQLRGLTQFKRYLGWNATADIILNFETSINPRSVEYPFTTNREGLKSRYSGIVDAICDKMSRAPISVSEDSKYKQTIYGELEDRAPVHEEVTLATAAISTEVRQVVHNLQGIEAQGGVVRCDLADYIQQYNSNIDSIAKQNNMSKSAVIKALSTDTLVQLNNPLKFSWIVCRAKEDKIKPLSQSKLVANVLKWSAILQLIAKTSNIDNDFYPGIVLEKETLGLCMEKYLTIRNEQTKRNFIMFNPLEMPSDASILEQAIWILNVASHELAHYTCNQLESHGETWAYQREHIFNRNICNLDTIIGILGRSKTTEKDKSKDTTVSSKTTFRTKTLEELEKLAIGLGIDVTDLKSKYSSLPIYRMRLTMKIKSMQ